MAWFLKRYECACGETWQDEWSCACNDRCPGCNKEIETDDYDDLSVIVEPQRMAMSPNGNPLIEECADKNAEKFVVKLSDHGAEDDPEYLIAAEFKTRAEAEAFAAKLSTLVGDWGFKVGTRDPRINTNYPGSYMAAEEHQYSELPTKDGSNGPWCIVGDDLTALVNEAHSVWDDRVSYPAPSEPEHAS